MVFITNIHKYILLFIGFITYIMFLASKTNIQHNLSGFLTAPVARKIFIDKDGNEVPVFDEETLFPKPGGGYCKMTNITDMIQYFNGVENPTVECKKWEVFNGGYKGCMDGFENKYNCVVLSFGSNFNFHFEDSIISKYGCMVSTFDPTLETDDFVRNNGRNKFYDLGLSSFKGIKRITYQKRKDVLAKVDRYINIVGMLGLENSEIDFLKIDIEGSELDFFLDTASNNPELLGKVRQIYMEFHNLEKFNLWHSGNRLDTTQFDMMKIVDILHCHGFALAHSKKQHNTKLLFTYKGKTRGYNYITTWIRV